MPFWKHEKEISVQNEKPIIPVNKKHLLKQRWALVEM